MPIPLPKYNHVSISDIKPASTLLFYGGNKLTEFAGNKIFKHQFKPPAFHAAFFVSGFGNGLFLNVGRFKCLQEITPEFRTTRRIDAIVYKDMTDLQRTQACYSAQLDTSKPKVGLSLPDYDWIGYLRFGLKFLKPSKKKDFCSDNVVDLFETVGVKTTDKKDGESTAPWDLMHYAYTNPNKCEIHTIWCGKDFKG